jgi:hypothetical protein
MANVGAPAHMLTALYWRSCNLSCIICMSHYMLENIACLLTNWQHTCTVRVYENNVLRLFGPNEEEVTGQWIKSHNEELLNLCCPLILLGQWRQVWWDGQDMLHRTVDKKCIQHFSTKTWREENAWGLGLDGRIMWKWRQQSRVGGCVLYSCGLVYDAVGSYY